MTFISDNIYVIIIIGIIALIYLLHYYIRSTIDNEIGPLKKKIKKLYTKNLEQTNNKVKDMKISNVTEDIMYEKTEIDADSYFDPTKSGN